jgi:hypothetical protein
MFNFLPYKSQRDLARTIKFVTYCDAAISVLTVPVDKWEKRDLPSSGMCDGREN